MTNNPQALNVVEDLQERVLSFVKNFHNEVDTSNIYS
jgi:hypothetical protein